MSRLLLAGALLLVACASEPTEDPIDPATLDPGERGPYNPAYQVWELTYDPGLGAGERTIAFNVWYPTGSDAFDEVVYTYELFDDDRVVPDGPLAPALHADGYPVHVHSHGHMAFGGSSAFLARHLATHGWITIAPDHTDNLFFDTVEPRPADLYIHRSTDLTAVLDELERWEPAADTERVALSGHSFGAYSVWAAGGATFDPNGVSAQCAGFDPVCTAAEEQAFLDGLQDERVVALLPMAGTLRRSWFGDEGHRAVEAPVLFLSGTDDPVGQQEQWDGMDTVDFTWIDLEGACHQAFALGGCSEIDTDRAFGIVQTYALAFARRHVLGDTAAGIPGLLDGSTEVDPAVAFQRMNAGP